MKKLRILFLAVLAMALMASGAFATTDTLSVGDKTTIADLNAETEVEVTLTLATAPSGSTKEAVITVGGFDDSFKVAVKDGAELTDSSATFTITVADGENTGTATLVLTNLAAKDTESSVTLTCSDPSVNATISITKVSAPTAGGPLTVDNDTIAELLTSTPQDVEVTLTLTAAVDGNAPTVAVAITDAEGATSTAVSTNATGGTLTLSGTDEADADSNYVYTGTLTVTGVSEVAEADGPITITLTYDPDAEAQDDEVTATITVTKVTDDGGAGGPLTVDPATIAELLTSTPQNVEVTLQLEQAVAEGEAAPTVTAALPEGVTAISLSEITMQVDAEDATKYTGTLTITGTAAKEDATVITLTYDPDAEAQDDEATATITVTKVTDDGGAGGPLTVDNDTIAELLTSTPQNVEVTLQLEQAVAEGGAAPTVTAALPEGVTAISLSEITMQVDAEDATKYTGTLTITGTAAKEDATVITLTYDPDAEAQDDEATATITVTKVTDDGAAGETAVVSKVSADKKVVTIDMDAGTKTADVNIVISLDKAFTVDGAEVSLDVSSDNEAIATVAVKTEAKLDTTDTDKVTYNAVITITGVASGDTKVTVKATASADKAAIGSGVKFEITVHVLSSDTETGEDSSGGKEGISWGDTTDIQNWGGKLYVSGDEAVFTVTVLASKDYTLAFETSPDTHPAWTLTSEKLGSASTTSGTYTLSYDIVLTPSTTVSQDSVTYELTAYVTTSTDLTTEAIKFKVAVLESDDSTSGEDSSSTDTYTLEMKTPVVDKKALMQGGVANVRIAVTPMRATGTYTFDFTGNETVFTVEEAAEKQDTSAQTNYVDYKLQAAINATAGDYTFEFTVESGDGQEVSADVTFTVSALDLSGMNDTQKEDYIKNNPAPKPSETTTPEQKAANKAAFAAGEGTAKFGFKSAWPVKKTGWRLFFGRNNSFIQLLNFMRWLLGGEYTYYESAIVSVFAQVASNDNTDAVTVSVANETEAEYEVDVKKLAFGLDKDGKFAVTPAIIPSAYDTDDTANIDDQTKASMASEDVGTITGTKPDGQTPGEQDPGTDPGTDPSDPGSDLVDSLLGGSSGGCDAGFGALALALAASMIFVRKRS